MSARGRLTVALAALVLASLAAGRARAQDCAEGRVRSEGRCCWPGQTWSVESARCEGAPACPIGLVEHGETCVAPAERVEPTLHGARTRDAYADPSMPRAASTEGWPVAEGALDAPVAWPFPGRGEDEGLISVAFAVFDVGWLLGWIGILADEAAGCATDGFFGGGTGRTFSCGGWQLAGVPLVGGLVGGMVNFSPGWRRSSFGIGFGIPSIMLQGIGLFIMLPIAFANSTSEPAFMPIHLNDEVTASLELSAPGADAGLSLDVSF